MPHMIVILLLCADSAMSSWWFLAMPSTYQMTLHMEEDYKDQCRKMHYLVPRQRELCTLSKNLLTVVSKGAQLGLRECQAQFAGRRWNCSTQFGSFVRYASDRLRNKPGMLEQDSTNYYTSYSDQSYYGLKRVKNSTSLDSTQGELTDEMAKKSTAFNGSLLSDETVSSNASVYDTRARTTKISKFNKSTIMRFDGFQSDGPADDIGDVFGGVLKYHSREKAYVHAISAAGVAYSITRSCSKGELPSCSCDKHVHRRTKNKGQFEWGGCSEDLAYGERLSKDFVDSNELAKSWMDPSTKMMNLHNNEAGRRAIRSGMHLMCKCHGVSGSCTVKICWRRMGDFKTIGEELYKKFDGATRVKFSDKKHKLQPAIPGHKRPTKRDLVYLQESPDFCQENSRLGLYGTRNRKCNKNSHGTDGCSILCCGRGYTTTIIERTTDCNCRFVWCCEVKCDKCKTKIEENFCK